MPELVYAYETPEDPDAPSVFLAGPTPRSTAVPSWRPAAIAAIREQWRTGPLTILIPEPRNGQWAADYTVQYDWERRHMGGADALLFWVPRCLRTLPGFTTNVEWGRYGDSGRAVLGVPEDCPDARRNRYLIHDAHTVGAPVRTTLPGAVAAALDLAQAARP